VAVILLATFGTSVLAGSTRAAPPTTPPPAVTVPNPSLPNPPPPLSPQELRDLVAPVALYPDVVLASLLPATTFPDQVHDAAGWVAEQGTAAETAPEDRGWDGSITALLQFPDVLRWLDTNREWTQEMGQAVTYQQGDVLDAIQSFRRATADAGNLKSNEYQTVRAVPNEDIRIAPARPDVVYVPSYDPVAATQPQSPGVNPWLAFGGGVAVGALGAWALYSIFDDDDDHHHHSGYRSRRINCYNNYYYAGRRRPPRRAWRARPYAYGAPRPRGTIARPTRLEHVATRPAKPMRPPRRPPLSASARPPRRQMNAGGTPRGKQPQANRPATGQRKQGKNKRGVQQPKASGGQATGKRPAGGKGQKGQRKQQGGKGKKKNRKPAA